MNLEKPLLALILAAVLLFAAITWEESHADRIRLESTIDAQQHVIAAAASREKDRDAQLQTTLAQIAAAKRSAQTPEQILRLLPQYLQLPQPITMTPASSATGSGKGTGANALVTSQPAPDTDALRSSHGEQSGTSPSSPNPAPPRTQDAANLQSPAAEPTGVTGTASSPPSATIPAQDLKPLFDYIQDCRACQAQLTSTTADLADAQQRNAALTRERDAALKAAKGGTFTQRLKHNAKWLTAGAIIAIALMHLR